MSKFKCHLTLNGLAPTNRTDVKILNDLISLNKIMITFTKFQRSILKYLLI
jgi:hypothetical protein